MKLQEELRDLQPRTKSKRLWSLWPTIEVKLAEGASYAQVLELLNRNGFELTAETFRTYVRRFLKRRRQTQTPMAVTVEFPLNGPKEGLRQANRDAVDHGATTSQKPRTFDYDPRGIPDLLK